VVNRLEFSLSLTCQYGFIANVVVQEIGDLGVAILQVNDEVKPKTLPSRKLPLSLQDDVKREIDKLVERNVLVPVTEPTEWVSQMIVRMVLSSWSTGSNSRLA
jgi:hypothetical protein